MGVEEDGVVLAAFAYDALGRRTQAIEGSVTRFFVYDGADAVLVGEDAQRAPIVHGSGVDEPLLYNAPGSTLVTPLSDGLGSITEELDANGVVFRARRYLAYGDIVETVGTGPTSYAFTARVFDDATGLQYSRARHYDPKVGRFLQQDPIGFAGGDANLYAYTFANPVNYTDPDGQVALQLLSKLFDTALKVYSVVSVSDRILSEANRRAGEEQRSCQGATGAAGRGRSGDISDDDNVVRGGMNYPNNIIMDSHPSGAFGFSAQSAPALSVAELSVGVPHGQVGFTTVGAIRAMGGDVIRTSGRSPNHVTVTGLSPMSASVLLRPTIPNPSRVSVR